MPQRRVHASSLCVPKTSPQSALRSGPSLAQSEGSDSPDVSVTTPSIGPQTLMREPWVGVLDLHGRVSAAELRDGLAPGHGAQDGLGRAAAFLFGQHDGLPWARAG